MNAFQTIDWIEVFLTFVVLLGIAWWVIRQKQEYPPDYFLAGRDVGWFMIGASLFASNIGSEHKHIVGLAVTAANSGVIMGNFEWYSWLVLRLGWGFVPFYRQSRVFNMPEFLEKCYSSSARWFLLLVALIGYVPTTISVTVYAGTKPMPGAELFLLRI